MSLESISEETFDEKISQSAFWQPYIHRILERHQLPPAPLKSFVNGSNVIFAYDQRLIIKLFAPFHEHQFLADRTVLAAQLKLKTALIPELIAEGRLDGWPYLIMSLLPGIPLDDVWPQVNQADRLTIVKALAQVMAEVQAWPLQQLQVIDRDWDSFMAQQHAGCIERHQRFGLPSHLLQQIPGFLARNPVAFGPKVLLTGEYTSPNLLLVQRPEGWRLGGLIDFGDAMLGPAVYDLSGPILFVLNGDPQLVQTFFQAAGYTAESLNDSFAFQLMSSFLLHRYANFPFQIRLPLWETVPSLEALARRLLPW